MQAQKTVEVTMENFMPNSTHFSQFHVFSTENIWHWAQYVFLMAQITVILNLEDRLSY